MPIGLDDPDFQIRLAAFRELSRLTSVHGPVLTWVQIAQGFYTEDAERYLFANRARGIFRPAQMRGAALSIKTTVPRTGRIARYDDEEGSVGEFRYRMQGEDPDFFDNRLLQIAHESQAR